MLRGPQLNGKSICGPQITRKALEIICHICSKFIVLSRAAQMHLAGHVRPVSRVFETPFQNNFSENVKKYYFKVSSLDVHDIFFI